MNPILRRQQIGEMVARGEQISVKQLASFYQVHPSTIYKDLRDLRTSQAPKLRVGEMMGRTAPLPQMSSVWAQMPPITIDWTQMDYSFWAKLRRGKAQGYEIGGLFARPIGRILTAWVFGDGPTIAVNDASPAQKEAIETACAEFLRTNRENITEWAFDGYTVGDGYRVVNVDGSLTNIPANQVEIIPQDIQVGDMTIAAQGIKGYRITTRTDKETITDEYRRDGRTVTVKKGDVNITETFQNLIGRLSVVHFANEREANEMYGHPVYEALLYTFALYHDLFKKSADGVKLMGHPIPVVENLKDPVETLENNATGTRTIRAADGSEVERKVIDFSVLDVFLLGEGGRFVFAQPGTFVTDAEKLLQYLFLLVLQHVMIPEWAWGGAIASSKASVDGQMPAFIHAINWRRSQIESLLLELVRVWLATQALVEPSLRGAADLNLQVKWPALTTEDAELLLKWATEAYDRGLIQGETFVQASGLADDPAAEIASATQQAQEKQDGFDQRVELELLQTENADLRSQLAERNVA